MYNQLKKMRQEEGFTLIELLIVIVILGVLAGIVVFSVQGITDRGTKTACKSDIAEVQTAVESYYAQTGTYPSNIDPQLTTQDLTQTPKEYKFLQSAPGDVTLSGPGGAVAPTVTGTGSGC